MKHLKLALMGCSGVLFSLGCTNVDSRYVGSSTDTKKVTILLPEAMQLAAKIEDQSSIEKMRIVVAPRDPNCNGTKIAVEEPYATKYTVQVKVGCDYVATIEVGGKVTETGLNCLPKRFPKKPTNPNWPFPGEKNPWENTPPYTPKKPDNSLPPLVLDKPDNTLPDYNQDKEDSMGPISQKDIPILPIIPKPVPPIPGFDDFKGWPIYPKPADKPVDIDLPSEDESIPDVEFEPGVVPPGDTTGPTTPVVENIPPDAPKFPESPVEPTTPTEPGKDGKVDTKDGSKSGETKLNLAYFGQLLNILGASNSNTATTIDLRKGLEFLLTPTTFD